MKRWWVFILPLILAVVAVSVFSDQHADKETAEKPEKVEQGKTMTISGEVIDTVCYATSAGKRKGEGHASCAEKCIKGGLPVGILDGETVYLVVTKSHKLANQDLLPHAAKKVSVTGKVYRFKGLNMIKMESFKPMM